MHKFYAYKKR